MDDLIVSKGIWQIRFAPAGLLFDNRGKIATEWQHKNDLSEWRISTRDVLIHSLSMATYLHVSHNELSTVMEMPPSYEDFETLAVDFSIKTLDLLKIRQITRVGLRLILTAKREHFRSLATKIRTNLYRVSEEQWGALGGYPEDIGTSVVIKLGDNKANFSIGPMERQQLAEHFQSDPVKAGLPDTALYVDVDLFRDKPKWNNNSYHRHIPEFLKDAKEVRKRANDFINQFEGFL